MNKLESNTPDGPSVALPAVTVCAAVSSLIHKTVCPLGIFNLPGEKQLLVSSHPGPDEPRLILTIC